MLNKFFARKEFKCKCNKCDYSTVDAELLTVITDVREHFGKPVVINSGHRCPAHNKAVGGAANSIHMTGKAADIRVSGVSPDTVHAYLTKKYPGKYGIGKYNSFTHIDTRDYCSRWNG